MTAALKPLAALAVLAFALICIVTVHGSAARDTGLTRVELFEPVKRASRGMNSENCNEYLVISCPTAITHDAASPNYGKSNPHAKLACCDRRAKCIAAIIGLKDITKPALVTVIPMTREALMKTAQRDNCFTASPKWALMLVDGVLK